MTIVAGITTARMAQALDPRVSEHLVVFFDASASDLSRAEMVAALERELHRSVRVDSEPEAATLFIRRDAAGNLVVRYRPPPGELAHTFSVANADEGKARQIALIAKSLVTGASDVDQARAKASEGGPAASVPHPVPASAPSEGQASFALRVSGALGFGNAPYEYRAASGIGGLDATITGPVAAVYAGLGHRRTGGTILGAELGAIGNGPLSNHGRLAGHQLGPFALRIQLGPFVDYSPSARARLRLQAGVGIARYFFQYAVAACDTSCGGNFDARDAGRIGASLWGGTGYLGIAHDVGATPGTAGLFVRTSFGVFAAERTTLWPLEVSAGATVTWF